MVEFVKVWGNWSLKAKGVNLTRGVGAKGEAGQGKGKAFGHPKERQEESGENYQGSHQKSLPNNKRGLGIK